MSTQYDDIGSSYDGMKKLPVASIERWNVQLAVAPYIKGASVLDLACGTGYYSRALLEWGASRVVGVDISSTMVDLAQNCKQDSDESRYEVGDCSISKRYDGGPFDLVLGSWLLNYASSEVELIKFFRNIALNLKQGGHFIGVTPHPTEDPRTYTEAALGARPLEYGGVTVKVLNDIEGGVTTHLEVSTSAGHVAFDGYYLRRSVYERSAKAGGLMGDIVWRQIEKPPSGFEPSSWSTYMAVPHCSILVVAKD